MALSRFRNALVLALVAAAGRAAAGTWSVTLAPSLTNPRLADLNSALSTWGIGLAAQALAATGATGTSVAGFERVRWSYGGDLSACYTIDEDIRVGLTLGMQLTPGNDTLRLAQVSGATTTLYDVSASLSLPVGRLSAFVQKTFRFEDNPNLFFYVGGWGTLGSLLGASIHGDARNLTTQAASSYRMRLSGAGWGGGGEGGVEFGLGTHFSLFLESGFDVFQIGTVDARPSGGGAFTPTNLTTSPFTNGSGKPIALDFSGVFIRLGVRASFPSAS